MSSGAVLDCSVAMTWCFHEEITPATRDVLDIAGTTGVVVPALWEFEIANVMIMAERKKRLSISDIQRFCQRLSNLKIERDLASSTRGLSTVLEVARKYKLTAYDAAYLELAKRLDLPLATLDNELRLAAEATQVRLLGR